MSCDVAAALVLMFAAHAPADAPAMFLRAADPVAAPAKALAAEPLFADIVGRAGRLLSVTNAYRQALAKDAAAPLPDYALFKRDLQQLSDLDFKAHEQLEARGQDSDLKCILRGISADLTLRVAALDEATDVRAKDKALRELGYLLNDNVEVIKAPPAPPV